MASWRTQLRQYDGYVGRNLRARILRVDAPQAVNITARYGVQLPVHHLEITPEWWRYQQQKAAMKIAYRDETGITVKDTVRLPVSIDMIQGHHAEVRRGEYPAIDLAVYTAEMLRCHRCPSICTQENLAPTCS